MPPRFCSRPRMHLHHDVCKKPEWCPLCMSRCYDGLPGHYFPMVKDTFGDITFMRCACGKFANMVAWRNETYGAEYDRIMKERSEKCRC